MKEYGQRDEDSTSYDFLMQYLNDNKIEAAYIMHHQRVPANLKQCRWPCSVRTQAVLADGKVVTSIQLKPGAEARIERN